MKICILTNNRPHTGGMTTYINSVTHGFQNLNHQVDIINMFGCFKYLKTQEKIVNLSEGWIKKFKNSGKLILMLMFVAKLMTAWHTWLACLKNKYDFFFCQDENSAQVAEWMKKIFKIKTPILLIIHASLSGTFVTQNKMTEDSLEFKKVKALEKKSFERADKILVVSQYVKSYVETTIGKTDKVFVLPAPIDKKVFKKDLTARNEWRRKYNLENKFVMLFAGRLAEIKGGKYPIQVLKELNLENVELIYVGQGPEENFLKNKTHELNLEEQVKFLGNIDLKNMPNIYNMVDVCLITSITHGNAQEGSPLTSFESIACGLPIVAFKSGGLAENVKHGQTGFLVEEKDVKSMAEYVKQLYENKKLAQELANGAEKLSEEFGAEKTAQKIIQVFSDI